MSKHASIIGSIPDDGIAIASLEHGGWRTYLEDVSRIDRETLSGSRQTIMTALKCFRDDLRTKIVLLLERTPRQGAGDLVKSLNNSGLQLTQPGVSHHLSLMRRAGMASSSQEGQTSPHVLSEQCHQFLSIIRSIRTDPTIDDAAWILMMATLVHEPIRMKILQMLERESMSVIAMCRKLSMSQPAVSYHLALMLQQGVLSMKKEGQCSIYTLERSGRSYLHAIQALEQLQEG